VTLCALVAFAGCDLGGTYGKRYEESLVSVGKRAAVAAMLHGSPTSVPDAAGKPSGVQLRLPSVFDIESTKSLPASEARAQPPFLKIPGFNYAYERMLDHPDDASKPESERRYAPSYCYLGAVPKTEQKADAIMADLLKQAQAAFPGVAWADEQVSSPEGAAVTVKVLSMSGQQDFDGAQIQKPVEKLDGRMDLYLYESETHVALIGFRAPTAQAGKYQYFEAAKTAIGTIQAGG
jgi:hypothetical protein